ncbi:MAG TPA: transglutaminase family protein, partial [Bacteroidales bacterium]|nr:transglutaminase family protein [Bacteroidales bacterium]
MKLDSELLSITVLMDDSDNSVREAVIERLIARGEEALSVLEQFVAENKLNISSYQQLITEVKERIAFNKFLNYLNSKDHSLIDGLVLLTKCVDPQWDERNFLFVVSEMSDDIIKEFSDDNTDFEKLNIFNYCFFKRFGFNISLTDASEEWREIDKVIEKRDGSSITVSIIYFLLA